LKILHVNQGGSKARDAEAAAGSHAGKALRQIPKLFSVPHQAINRIFSFYPSRMILIHNLESGFYIWFFVVSSVFS
jgi:hypothetical protein